MLDSSARTTGRSSPASSLGRLFGPRRHAGLPVGSIIAALDGVRANVMITDGDMTIVHLNKSVVALLTEAQADLRRDLPQFDVNSLIGRNVDMFYRPSRQRGIATAPGRPPVETIQIGGRLFDLLITPLSPKDARSGFAIEWDDATSRLKTLDDAAQVEAIWRSQAVIEFSIDGVVLKANETFLRTFGYTLDEVRGKPHRQFLAPEERDGQDYVAFWTALRSGRYQSGQFRRIGKAGQPIWIVGSYHPILDDQGRVSKVVKFATDVSAQARQLSDLKALIDRNFGEIDDAMARRRRSRRPPRPTRRRATCSWWPPARASWPPRSARSPAAWPSRGRRPSMRRSRPTP